MKFDIILLFFILVIVYDSLAMDTPPGGSGRAKGERSRRNRQRKLQRGPDEFYTVNKNDFYDLVQKTTGKGARKIPQEVQTPGRYSRLMSGLGLRSSRSFETGQSSSTTIGLTSTQTQPAQRPAKRPADHYAEQPARQPGQLAQQRLIENPALQRPSLSRSGNPSGYSVHENPSGYLVYGNPSAYPVHQDPSRYPAHQNPSTYLRQNRLGSTNNHPFSTLPSNWSTPHETVQQLYPNTDEIYRQQLAHQQRNPAQYQHGIQQNRAQSYVHQFSPDEYYKFLPRF